MLLAKADNSESTACPVDAALEAGLNFSTGMPPNHSEHEDQPRKPSCYTQTINCLSTPRTDPAQLSK